MSNDTSGVFNVVFPEMSMQKPKIDRKCWCT